MSQGPSHPKAADCPGDHAAPAPMGEHQARDIVCIDKLTFAYPGRPPHDPAALENVTLHLHEGDRVGLIGPNGAGKTTLLRMLLGELKPDAGEVRIAGLSPRQAVARGDLVGYVPQRHGVAWQAPISARQVVHMGLTGRTGLWRRPDRASRDHADAMLAAVGMADLRDRPIRDLSGGQQQRLFIARALACRPRLLVLDEPLVGVDAAQQQQFARLIDRLHEQFRLTLLVVSHDLQAIAAGCDRVACLNRRLHYHDHPQGLTAEVLRAVFEHDVLPLTYAHAPLTSSPTPTGREPGSEREDDGEGKVEGEQEARRL